MRIIIFMLFLSLSFSAFAMDTEFTKEASGKPVLLQTGPQKAWCPVCGMNLKMFYKTNHAMKLSGGMNKQYCSIRCLLEDYEGLQGIVKQMLVIDAASEKFIDVNQAHYVVGSKAPGTMTMTSKYAFSSQKDAEEFQKKMGGELMSFTNAKASALRSMEKDVNMTNNKRTKMMYPMGEQIFNKVCDKSINPLSYNLINELKADIRTKNLCGDVKEKQLQAVALYLWDIVRKQSKSDAFISIAEDEKCPVCGMFVHKYPKWVAKTTYNVNGAEAHSVFDGVKDMMKFYFNPGKWGKYTGITFSKIEVSDYYSNRAVDAKTAFYVIGSDVYGPMGKELIPFSTKANAETFSADHNGKQILSFSEITEKLVYKLDE